MSSVEHLAEERSHIEALADSDRYDDGTAQRVTLHAVRLPVRPSGGVGAGWLAGLATRLFAG